MTRELDIILVKFLIITALIIIYVFVALYYIAPAITHMAYGQYGGLPQDQYNTQQFQQNPYDQNQQFNQGYNQQYQDPNQFNQGYNQFQQQPYQQYGPQYGTPYMQQPYGQQGFNQFGLQEIIYALMAGGGAAGYTRWRTNKLENDKQLLYAETLKGKQVDAELARVMYEMNKTQADQLNNAPAVKLDNLQKDVQDFTQEAAKA